MNFFETLTSGAGSGRVARLISDGTRNHISLTGQAPDAFQLLNIRRKAEIVNRYSTYESDLERFENRSNVFCDIGDTKISNRFVLPADGYVQIAPYGIHPHPKGIDQVIDEQAVDAMINRFNEEKQNPSFAGIKVDFDHKSQDPSGTTEAAGWATDLQKRADGLYANIRWSNSGLAKVEGGEYRFTSPVWFRKDCVPVNNDDKKCRPVRLAEIAVTNDNNLKPMRPMTA
jgi:Mu-like prophage I protein